ncbi:DUF4190 domain-containing protein [Promicromonospora sukumoe]|uniref:DUF4190 domain-containing protein n=1 Tax=Promicromonospora sukumoe TaxID=88382 RepID=UPI00365581D5
MTQPDDGHSPQEPDDRPAAPPAGEEPPREQPAAPAPASTSPEPAAPSEPAAPPAGPAYGHPVQPPSGPQHPAGQQYPSGQYPALQRPQDAVDPSSPYASGQPAQHPGPYASGQQYASGQYASGQQYPSGQYASGQVQPYPPQGQSPYYGAAPQYGYVPAPPKNDLGVWSLVTGILSWVMCPLVLGVVAIVTGNASRRAVRDGLANNPGSATAGLVLGWINVGLAGLAILVWIVLIVFGLLGAAFSVTQA